MSKFPVAFMSYSRALLQNLLIVTESTPVANTMAAATKKSKIKM